MALSLAIFQLVIEFIAEDVLGGVVNVLDSVYLLESPHMSFLDLMCVVFIIDEVWDFLHAMRGPIWRDP